MKDMHKLGDHAARLDVIKYTTCISALSHKGHAQLAEDLLNEMRRDFLEGNAKAEPNAKLYEFVIGAWTGEGKGSKIDGYRAQELLHQMWAMHDNGSFRDIRPTIHTYSLVILAMTKTRHPDRANELLDQMERYYERGFIRTGGVNQKLHRQLYQTVIHSWEHSRLADRKKSAQQLSVKMFRRFGSKPHDH